MLSIQLIFHIFLLYFISRILQSISLIPVFVIRGEMRASYQNLRDLNNLMKRRADEKNRKRQMVAWCVRLFTIHLICYVTGEGLPSHANIKVRFDIHLRNKTLQVWIVSISNVSLNAYLLQKKYELSQQLDLPHRYYNVTITSVKMRGKADPTVCFYVLTPCSFIKCKTDRQKENNAFIQQGCIKIDQKYNVTIWIWWKCRFAIIRIK